MTTKEKNDLIGEIEKEIGEGVLLQFDKDNSLSPDDVISTGSLNLNKALGIGGLKKGTIVEIYGPESSGKTTLAIHLIAECQKQGGEAVIIDAEHSFDLQYAQNIGVDTDRLLVSQPDYGEQGLQVVAKLVNSGKIDLIVVDSVAALVPKAEMEGDIGDSKVGLQARLMSQSLRMLTGPVSKNRVLLVFINQLRDKIGVMYGSPEVTTGGNALKFYTSTRLDIRRIATIKEGEESVSNRVKVKVVKNKVAAPFKQAEFNIVFGQGIDRTEEIIDLAIQKGIIKKGGSWLTYGDYKFQGKKQFHEALSDNDGFKKELEEKVCQD